MESPTKRRQTKTKRNFTTRTLTFVDMSNLSYLSKSNLVAPPKRAIIDLPQTTASPILEEDDDSHTGSDDDDTETMIVTVDTAETIAKNIIDQLINVVIEAETVETGGDIEDNDMILDNISNIHK